MENTFLHPIGFPPTREEYLSKDEQSRNSIFERAVYRKVTHINRHLNAQSHHHPIQIQGMTESPVSRSQQLADADHIRTDSNEIKHILPTNDATTHTINRALRTKKKPTETTLHRGYNG
ncbi:hypothetical protein Trydic_g74 [Trypoxylus dichotomus]